MVLKFFTKKIEEPPESYDYADFIKSQLDNITSDFKLGLMTESEYKALCQTINDSALKLATERIERLEDDTRGTN